MDGTTRERALVGLVAVALIAAGATAWWLLGAGEETEAEVDEGTQADAELEQWGVVEPRSPRGAAPRSDTDAPPDEDPERAARRARRQERWRRAVDIVPLGPAAPGIEPDQIRDALAPGRPALRQCIRDQGGWRALREARRSEREARGEDAPAEKGSRGRARRPRRRASLDVRPDGTVDPSSIELQPPMPEPFSPCFRAYLSSARFEAVGPDGARLEIPMGRPRGRRRLGDGGVRPWRGRGEGTRRGRGEGTRRGRQRPGAGGGEAVGRGSEGER